MTPVAAVCDAICSKFRRWLKHVAKIAVDCFLGGASPHPRRPEVTMLAVSWSVAASPGTGCSLLPRPC
uniref:Uncharacterized protein n=1 Tax=Triticum urartu TaxID=4572 RepID=A0A8R7Q8H3_TRIUA